MRRYLVCLLVLLGLALLAGTTATGPPAEATSMFMESGNFDSASTPALATLVDFGGGAPSSGAQVYGVVVAAELRPSFNTITLIGEVPPASAEARPRLVPAVMTYIYTGHNLESDRNLRRLSPARASTFGALRI